MLCLRCRQSPIIRAAVSGVPRPAERHDQIGRLGVVRGRSLERHGAEQDRGCGNAVRNIRDRFLFMKALLKKWMDQTASRLHPPVPSSQMVLRTTQALTANMTQYGAGERC